MNNNLKEIHERIKAKKKEKKEVAAIFRDVLAQSKSYQEVLEQMKALKIKKTQIENALRSDMQKEIEKKERIALDLKTDTQLMSDIALNQFMKGQTVELTDDNNVKYEPVFKVSFKKAS